MERIDNIGFGDLKLIQDPDEFCYGVDAVILADFAAKHAAGRPETIVDLGTGTGVIPLILSAKTDATKICGLELQKASYERAVRNIELNAGANGIGERLRFFLGDVKSAARDVLLDMKGTVDVVTTNPPYMQAQGGLTCANSAKSIARHETSAGLEDFFACAADLLKNRGELFMVHRPSRLADICCYGRKYGLEPKEMCFVAPNVRKAPNIILVHFVKGGGKELRVLDPLFVYDENGEYTAELRKCYE